MASASEARITLRALFGFVATLVALLSLVAVLHANFVIPALLQDARALTEGMIDRHGAAGHAGALRAVELRLMIENAVQPLEAGIARNGVRLEAISERLSALEARK